jgi:hypothetical protein
MEPGVLLIIQLVLRIVGVVVCSNKAKELNRSTGGWGFFGFISPLIAMIWIYCLKPITNWDTNIDINSKK